MNNITKIVDDIFRQLDLYSKLEKKATISVYLARQNLNPVLARLLTVASELHGVKFETLAVYTEFLERYTGHVLNIWQKDNPYPELGNHLLLTVGGLTAIIFDYEESK